MRLTFAIATTETRNRTHLGHLGKKNCPFVFEMFCLIANPNFYGRDMLSQVIDVPVFPFVRAQVTGDARLYATRYKGAADINIIAESQVKLSPAAYLDRFN